MTEDEFSQVSWAAFITWASEQPDCIAEFNEATGRRYREARRNPTDNELAADTEAFVEWLTMNHWGVGYAPQAYRAAKQI